MKKTTKCGLALTVLVTLATTAQAEIIVGAVGPMSGPFEVFGAQMRAGAAQAVADINAAGGVLGEPVVLEVADDACDPEQAIAVANQMAGKGAAMVAGHFCSIASIQAAKVYAAEEIIQISPGSMYPAFTDERPGPGIMRVCGRDDEQGEIAGEFLAANFASDDVAIVHDRSAYGKGLADQARNSMNAAGKTEMMVDVYDPGGDDYGQLVAKLKAAGVDVVYVGGYHEEAALMKLAMRDQDAEILLVSGDALMTEEFWATTGDAGRGTLMTYPPDPRKNPENDDLVARFRADGIEPEGYVLYTYAAIQAWAHAAEEAASTAFQPVVDALGSGEFETVLGRFGFDEKGDATLPGYVVYEWRNGKYDYYKGERS